MVGTTPHARPGIRFDRDLVRRGPRYTSYPTVRQFSEQVDVDDYRRALAHRNEVLIPAPLSLYVHVPFRAFTATATA